jgi:hypothetical protein
MRDAVAAPVSNALHRDEEMANAHFLDGRTIPNSGRADRLLEVLVASDPALVVTTSHGMTGPLDDPVTMRRNLGPLVDQQHNTVSTTAVVNAWQPDGAIWYAHACCSAGSDSPGAYAGLLDPQTPVDHILSGP